MKKNYCVMVLSCFALVFMVSQVYAQRPEGDPQGPRGRERVEQLRKMRLIETLGLDEEKSVRFVSRYSKHEEQLRTLLSERGRLIDDLEEAIKGSRESEYSKLIDGLSSIDRKIFEERIKFFKNLDDLLSKEQQAKLLVFERNFNRDLREMIFDARRGPGREPGREY